MNAKEMLKFAKLLEQEYQLRKKLQAMQEKLNLAGRFTCTERHGNGFLLHVALADVLALNPNAKAEWKTFPTDDGGEKGYFIYGPEHIGEISPGFHAWVKHETKTVVIREGTKPAEQIAA